MKKINLIGLLAISFCLKAAEGSVIADAAQLTLRSFRTFTEHPDTHSVQITGLCLEEGGQLDNIELLQEAIARGDLSGSLCREGQKSRDFIYFVAVCSGDSFLSGKSVMVTSKQQLFTQAFFYERIFRSGADDTRQVRLYNLYQAVIGAKNLTAEYADYKFCCYERDLQIARARKEAEKRAKGPNCIIS